MKILPVFKPAISAAVAFTASIPFAATSHAERFTVSSPDQRLALQLDVGQELTWSLSQDGKPLLEPGTLAMTLGTGEIWGYQAHVVSSQERVVDETFAALNYRKASVHDHCRELRIEFEEGFGLILRTYNDGAAYRFFTPREDAKIIRDETVTFSFAADHQALVPFMNDYRGAEVFNHSFEAYYDSVALSEYPQNTYAFLPLLVDIGDGRKVALLEADIENYPGLYLKASNQEFALEGTFARYPLATKTGGYQDMNLIPTERADYIARVDGARSFPWRIAVVSNEDRQLLDCDIVQKLAAPSRVADTSWIKPGLAVWDWWHEWTLRNVDFKSGQNTETYLYHIDFAAEHGLPLIVIDWGWTDIVDLTKRNPDVDLQAIVEAGKRKNVGVVVWASWQAVRKAKNHIFADLQRIGVKGMKIDFIDRDDQLAVASVYEIAALAAAHHLLVNYHGMYKPSGLQRTFPNVVNFEGVKGLENEKWADADAPRNAVTIPYIRMLAGPMDYTPGAMRNAAAGRFAAINDAPMSKGTRCHQLAMYVVYDAPMQMLCDSPSRYLDEPASLDFISRIPTTFDETVPLAGEVGEYVAIARRSGDTWYIGAMSNWTARSLTLDLSFLGSEKRMALVAEDGLNAAKEGTDHKISERALDPTRPLTIELAPAGGWAAILSPAPH